MEIASCSRLYADAVQIAACQIKLETVGETLSGLSGILALAGSEVRLKIIYLLDEEGNLCPCDLADILGMTIPAVSQHLRKLKDGGIVQTRKEGQTIYYSLTMKHLKILKPFFRNINLETKKLTPV